MVEFFPIDYSDMVPHKSEKNTALWKGFRSKITRVLRSQGAYT